MLASFGNYLYLCGIALAHERFSTADASGRRAVLYIRKTFSFREQTPTPFLYHKYTNNLLKIRCHRGVWQQKER